MTATIQDAFIADICEHPDDDTPRLIYADWLEDRGEEGDTERAEFIRVQVAESEAERLPASVIRPVDEILRGTGKWSSCPVVNTPGLTTWDNGTVSVKFRRGFLAEIHAPIAVLRQHLPRLVREHPIETVRTDKEPVGFNDSEDYWRWYKDGKINPYEGPADVPFDVWGFMSVDRDGDTPDVLPILDYRTAEAAHAVLSAAMLKWARRAT